MFASLSKYLEDPFLNTLYSRVRKAGSIKSISVDLTDKCNLRCDGCYFFREGMDSFGKASEAGFDDFIAREKERGTNFVTIVGGEPALELERLRKLRDNFKVNVATNGLVKIPKEGFEGLPFGIAIWGDADADIHLRGSGKVNVFEKALRNYHNDDRAFFYYTVTPQSEPGIIDTVRKCVDNGNRVLFNFFSDPQAREESFELIHERILAVIDLYPDMIFTTSYLSHVVSTGRLFDQKWSYEVCPNFSVNDPQNETRKGNGNPYSPHFNAYNSDLRSIRKCCTSVAGDCRNCYDVWQHFAWIIANFKKHLATGEDFANWLTTTYVFYLVNRLVDYDEGIILLPEIHSRVNRSIINNC